MNLLDHTDVITKEKVFEHQYHYKIESSGSFHTEPYILKSFVNTNNYQRHKAG